MGLTYAYGGLAWISLPFPSSNKGTQSWSGPSQTPCSFSKNIPSHCFFTYARGEIIDNITSAHSLPLATRFIHQCHLIERLPALRDDWLFRWSWHAVLPQVDGLQAGSGMPLEIRQNPPLEISQELAGNGVDVAVTILGTTPLRAAVAAGNAELVSFLLEQGALVNVVDGRDHSPLLVASSRGNERIASLLLSKGADIHRKGVCTEAAGRMPPQRAPLEGEHTCTSAPRIVLWE